MDKQIKTLSREEYRLYLSQRKPLDRDFTKLTINKYDDNRRSNDEKIETRKLEHKQKMETDEAYRDAYKEKTRKAYEKAKQRRLEKLEKLTPQPENQPTNQPTNQPPKRVDQEQVVPEKIEITTPFDFSDFLYEF